MKKIAIIALALVVGVVAVVVVRTMLYPWRQQVEAGSPSAIDIDEQAVAKRLSEAVQFRTISNDEPSANDPTQLPAFHEWLERTYPLSHSKVRREIVGDFSLLYTWPGTDAALNPVILLAHMDVAPVQPESEGNWTYPPFAGVISDGSVWGRGTLDMKSILVGIMEAVERQIARGHQPRRTIMIGFGHDEEVGGQNGAVQIVQLLKERGIRFEWVLDEGSAVVRGVFPGLESPLALIGVAEKGYVTLKLTARGSGGHTSMPPYDTAVTRLARAVTTLQENPFSGGIEGTAAEVFRAIGPQLPFYYRAAIANQWLFAPMLNRRLSASPQLNAILRTTIAPTMLTGSPKDNVLATEATASINLRIHPRDTVDTVLEHVRNLFPGNNCDSDESEICVEMSSSSGFANNPSEISSTESEGYRLVEKIAREIFQGAIVSPYLVIAATDSRHFAEIAGDIYRFGPFILAREDLQLLHGTNERISIKGFAGLVRFYIRLIENLNG